MKTENEFRAVIGERNICTSYYAGMLQGTLRTLCSKAFRAWVERELELESCMAKAEIYQKTKDKPIDNETMV